VVVGGKYFRSPGYWGHKKGKKRKLHPLFWALLLGGIGTGGCFRRQKSRIGDEIILFDQ
jgi:hypothetical protein